MFETLGFTYAFVCQGTGYCNNSCIASDNATTGIMQKFKQITLNFDLDSSKSSRARCFFSFRHIKVTTLIDVLCDPSPVFTPLYILHPVLTPITINKQLSVSAFVQHSKTIEL